MPGVFNILEIWVCIEKDKKSLVLNQTSKKISNLEVQCAKGNLNTEDLRTKLEQP